MLKIRRFRDLKLNTKFTVVIIVSLMISIGIFAFVFFYIMEKNVVDENTNYVEYTMARSADSLATNIDSINMATQFFLSDDQLLDILSRAQAGEEVPATEWVSFKKNTIASLEKLVNSNPILYGVRVYGMSDEVQEMMPILYKNSRMQQQEWAHRKNYYGWNYDCADQLFSSYTLNQNKKIASLVTPVESRKNGRIGVVETAVAMDEMFPSLYEDLENEWGYFIEDNGSAYYGNETEHQVEELLPVIRKYMPEAKSQTTYIREHGVNLMVEYLPVKELGGTLIFVKDISDSLNQVHRIRTIFILVMLLFFVILAFGISVIVRLMLGQFYEIVGVMRKVQKGDLNLRTKEYSGDEMGELSRQLNKMLDRIQTLMQDNIDRELLAKNSEIRALQNQINAHFIYNVLENIKMMAEIDEEYDISDAVTSLGKLLRYSMRWTANHVRVADELEYIRNFVALINLRFDYEILLSVKLEGDLEEQEIPKMSLQPIVENAILHGIEELAEDTTIYIKGLIEGNDCVIEITDGGKGMDAAQVEELEKKIAGKIESSGGSGKSNGIGLKNVQDRIVIAFGRQYGLKVVSKEGCFTKVIVRLPYQKRSASELKVQDVIK